MVTTIFVENEKVKVPAYKPYTYSAYKKMLNDYGILQEVIFKDHLNGVELTKIAPMLENAGVLPKLTFYKDYFESDNFSLRTLMRTLKKYGAGKSYQNIVGCKKTVGERIKKFNDGLTRHDSDIVAYEFVEGKTSPLKYYDKDYNEYLSYIQVPFFIQTGSFFDRTVTALGDYIDTIIPIVTLNPDFPDAANYILHEWSTRRSEQALFKKKLIKSGFTKNEILEMLDDIFD